MRGGTLLVEADRVPMIRHRIPKVRTAELVIRATQATSRQAATVMLELTFDDGATQKIFVHPGQMDAFAERMEIAFNYARLDPKKK